MAGGYGYHGNTTVIHNTNNFNNYNNSRNSSNTVRNNKANGNYNRNNGSAATVRQTDHLLEMVLDQQDRLRQEIVREHQTLRPAEIVLEHPLTQARLKALQQEIVLEHPPKQAHQKGLRQEIVQAEHPPTQTLKWLFAANRQSSGSYSG